MGSSRRARAETETATNSWNPQVSPWTTCSSKLGDGGPATSASLCAPTGVAVDSAGDVFIADSAHSEIRKVNTAGTISDYARTESFGYSGDGRAATKAKLGLPVGLALDSAKDLYIADSAYSLVREVTSTGTIKTFAGTGSLGYSGDGGPATKAKLSAPNGLGVDGLGDVFISDSGNNRIREVDTGGTMSRVVEHQRIGPAAGAHGHRCGGARDCGPCAPCTGPPAAQVQSSSARPLSLAADSN